MTTRARFATSLLGLGLSVVLGAPSASVGDPGPVSQLNWILDGAVETSVRVGNTLYVGGTFTTIAPAANALPPVFALSEASGAVAAPTFPKMNGDVAAIEPDGSGGYFLGGDFTIVGTLAQAYVTHILADGSVDPFFRPALTGPARSLARIGATLYIQGSFPPSTGPSSFGSVSTLDGARGPWRPAVPFAPSSMIAADDRIIISGTQTVPMIGSGIVAAYDSAAGVELWSTLVAPGAVGVRRSASALLRVGADVLVAHTGPSGLSRVSLATGTVDPGWNPQVSPTVMALSGPTVYLGGSFTSVAGQPRAALAAIDANTAALLPWNPGSLTPITRMAATSTGMVYVSGFFTTIAGEPRHRLAQIDSGGTVTGWVAAARPETYFELREGPAGSLLVASSVTATGHVPRRGLAAFDLTTGALLPWAPDPGRVLVLGAANGRVQAGGSSSVWMFDATTGALLGQQSDKRAFYSDDTWIYWDSSPLATGTPIIERAALASGAVDASWRPSVFAPSSVVRSGDLLYFASSSRGLAAVDRRTGHVRWANSSAAVSAVAISGDTLFGGDLRVGLGTFSARTGAAIGVAGLLTPRALAAADGRLLQTVSDVNVFARIRPMALTLDGRPTPWDPQLRNTLVLGPRELVEGAGDLLVVGGTMGTRTPTLLQGLAVFPLDGPRAPSGLRARPKGPATEFTWDAPTIAPAGGYVLEAGTTPGTPAVAIPAGAATSFSAVVPSGTFYVRVRTSGAIGGVEEVSNEIAVTGGCTSAPPPPTGLRAALLGVGLDRARISWVPPDALVSTYVLSAGTGPGLTNVGTLTLGGSATGFVAASAIPPGTYFVRLSSVNACGVSAPSSEVFFTVGTADTLPGAPTGLTASVAGTTVSLQWTPPAESATGYVLEAGSDVGLADIATASLGLAASVSVPGVPPGLYLVRVRAVNGAGSGPPSADVVVRVP